MKLLTWLLIVATLVALIWYAPKYLAYSDQPVKADVIVLFAGADWNARKQEALKLMEEGYAQHLLIPAYGLAVSNESVANKLNKPVTNKLPTNYPRHWEDTHIEILEAKKMMDKSGFKSAVFVSSPFHMRRIKIMAYHAFKNEGLNMKFVSTRYEKKTSDYWLFNKLIVENVSSEYMKTVWFFAYSMFS